MDRILIILKKENGPRASSAPALGLNAIIFEYVYWYMKQISGERLQDHWSSGLLTRTESPPVYIANRTESPPLPVRISIIILLYFTAIGQLFLHQKSLFIHCLLMIG